MAGLVVVPPDTHRDENRVDDISTIQPSTNSYGEFLPIGYGSARLPGHLIWAAPIREEVTSESVNIGKKSKKSYNETVDRYSYFATFIYAYALGPADGIGRAWVNNIQLNELADSGIEFEVYLGTPDQEPPDIPLMSNQRNLAYNDIVYVLFRDVLLTPFNNRIPTIDLEIVFNGEDTCQYEETFSDTFVGRFADTQAAVLFTAYSIRRILLATNAGILAVLNLDTLETIFEVNTTRTFTFIDTDNMGMETAREVSSHFVPSTLNGRFVHGYYPAEEDEDIYKLYKFDLLSGIIGPSDLSTKIPYAAPFGIYHYRPCNMDSFSVSSNSFGLGGSGHSGISTGNITITYADKGIITQPTLFNTDIPFYMCGISGLGEYTRNPGFHGLLNFRSRLIRLVQGSFPGSLEITGRPIAPVGHRVRNYEAIFLGALNEDIISILGIGYISAIGHIIYTIDFTLQDILNKASEYPTISEHTDHKTLIMSSDTKTFSRSPILFIDLALNKVYLCIVINNVSFLMKLSYSTMEDTTEILIEYVTPIPASYTNIVAPVTSLSEQLDLPLPQDNTQVMNWLPVSDGAHIWFIYTPTGRYIECDLAGYRTEQTFEPNIFWDSQLKELNVVEEVTQDIDGTPTPSIRLKRAKFVNIGGASGERVSIGNILQDLCLKAGLTVDDIDTSRVTETVQGYFINALQSASRSIEGLAEVYNINISEVDDRLVFIPNNIRTPLISIDKNRTALEPVLTRHSDHEIPSTYELQYYNHELAYQPNVIATKRPINPIGVVNNEQTANTSINIIENPTQVKRIANRKLYSIWSERDIVKTRLPLSYLALSVSDKINLEIDELGYTKSRIINYDVGADLSVDIEAVVEERADMPLTDSIPLQYTLDNIVGDGGNSTMPIINNLESQAIGLVVLDVPYIDVSRPSLLDDNITVLVGIQVFSDLFLGCSVSMSIDEGETFTEQTRLSRAQGITYGVMTSTLNAPISKDRWDYENSIDIRVIKGIDNFETITELQMLAGENVLLIKNRDEVEIVFFQNVEFIGTDTVRLTKLLRGRNGTDTFIIDGLTGLEVYLYSTSTFKQIHIPTNLIEKEVVFRATVYSLTGAAREVEVVLQANSLKPYSVVHDNIFNNILTWVRRTRYSGELLDYIGEVPLNEMSESYRITFKQNIDAEQETIHNSDEPMLSVPISFRDTDFVYKIQQVSSLSNLGFGDFIEYISGLFRINLEFMANIRGQVTSPQYFIDIEENALVLATITNTSETGSTGFVRLDLFNANTNSILLGAITDVVGPVFIHQSLNIGRYYYSVIGRNDDVNTDYTLRIVTPNIEALGNTNIVETANIEITELYYKYISLDAEATVTATITNIIQTSFTGSLYLTLYNAADQANNILQRAINSGNADLTLSRTLTAGTYYYIVTKQYVTDPTDFTLTISRS